MINRSGPPRFPIPNARIFITILNWLGHMLYSPEPEHILIYCNRSLLYDLEPMARIGEDPDRPIVRLSLF
jgi:hypothetical protein